MTVQAMPLLRHPFKAMGSLCEIRLHADADAAALAGEGEVRRLESKYSRFRDDSVTTLVNRSAGNPAGIDVDEETAALLDYAQTAHDLSGGLFDITSGVLRRAWDFKSNRLPSNDQLQALLPLVGWTKVRWQRPHLVLPAGMEIDFGGVVKEYAADRAAQACRDAGASSGFVELGGDIAVIGPHPDGAAWEIGVRSPSDPEKAAARIALRGGGIASSGDYERCIEIDGVRWCHILDPRTGWPARQLAGVSVIADQCLIAGTASTVAMLKPAAEARAWLATLGLPHLCIDAEGRLSGTLAVA
jgi:thiamine biosynthesis lipoprotein